MNHLQRVFDIIKSHLLAQGGPAIDGRGDGACAYRGQDGRTCAIGCLIPDERYHLGMEGKAVTHEDVGLSALRSDITDGLPDEAKLDFVDMLCELQSAHDSWYTPDYGADWPVGSERRVMLESDLKKIAEAFHLQYEVTP